MFQNIVVGTDGTDTADRAVARAAELAALANARLHVVSAYRPARVPADRRGETPQWSVGGDHRADAVLQAALARARAQGISVDEHAPKGDPADAIVEVATREGADLIVIGNKGMQGGRRVLGSIPNKVSHRAPCDVLIVRTD